MYESHQKPFRYEDAILPVNEFHKQEDHLIFVMVITTYV